jgi:nitrate/nitrite transporter NarK
MAMAALLHDPVFGLIGLCLAAVGQSSTLAPFWAMTTSFLSGTAAAGSIALINSVGNLGGYFGPQVMGRIKDQTKSFTAALLILAVILAFAGILSICAHHDPSLEAEPDEHIPDSVNEAVLETLIQ